MDLLPLLLIIGISLIVGIAIGFLLASLRQTPPAKSPPSSTPSAVNPPPPPLAAESPPKKGMVELLAGPLPVETRLPSIPPKSIAAQVDEILQERLQGTAFEHRAVRIMELPGKGMVVMVGLDRYESVNDVPDTEIQAVIRAAVAEWETRSSAV